MPPLQADCWPGTPVHAWDPQKALDKEEVPLWLGLELLEDLALLRESAHTSLSCQGIAAFLLARWERAGCTATVTANRLERVLGAALRVRLGGCTGCVMFSFFSTGCLRGLEAAQPRCASWAYEQGTTTTKGLSYRRIFLSVAPPTPP